MNNDQMSMMSGSLSWALTGFSLGVILCIVLGFIIVQSMRNKWQHEKQKSEADLQENRRIQEELGQKLRHQQEFTHSIEKDALVLEQQFAAAQEVWQEKEAKLQAQKQQMQT